MIIGSMNFSAPSVLFTGGALKTYHTFQPVHSTEIQEVNLGGYTYWAYHTLGNINPPFEVHLARSNSLTSGWVDEGKVFDGRWPSVYYDSASGTFHMFYREPAGTYQIRRATSSNGIDWTFRENVCAGANPYIWKNPNDNDWYLIYHNTGGAGYRILYRHAASITALATAEDTVILDLDDETASPTIYHDGTTYWLLVEDHVDNLWRTVLYSSTSLSGPYTRKANSLIADDACAMLFKKGNVLYMYYAERTSRANEYWDVVLRTAPV